MMQPILFDCMQQLHTVERNLLHHVVELTQSHGSNKSWLLLLDLAGLINANWDMMASFESEYLETTRLLGQARRVCLFADTMQHIIVYTY